MSRFARAASLVVLSGGFFLCPAESWAADETPSIVKYGLNGFWTGAQIGLASGYLATGKDYESEEWRKLAFGAGVGALVGTGIGITLGVLDVESGPPPGGGLVLRDMGYGVGLGALAGTAVGALFLIDDGDPKHLVTGAAIGTIAGAGVGVVFGVIEAAAASHEPKPVAPTSGSVRFTLIGSQDSYLPLPALQGTF
jgi:hypothetical protein